MKLSLIVSAAVFLSFPVLAETKASNTAVKKSGEESRGGKVKELSKKNIAVPQSKMEFEEPKPHNLNTVKPPKNLDIYTVENKSQADYEQALDKQITEIYALTRKLKNDPARGELWLRLAEAYIEKANFVNDRLQNEYDKKLEAFQAGKAKDLPKLDLTQARIFNLKAIELNQWFLRDFPKDEKVDQALFYIAYENLELGKGSVATDYYLRLVKTYPESRFAPEAHFTLGEIYFENEKWNEALAQYDFLVKDPKSPRHNVALYKSAWCLFTNKKTEQAITYMDRIINSEAGSEFTATSNGKKVDRLRLENEAIKDMILFFGDTTDAARAMAYFKALKNTDVQENLVKLAYRFSAKGSYDAARAVFKDIIAGNPNGLKNFDYQYQIVQDYYFSKKNEEFRKELFYWVGAYAAGTPWHTANAKETEYLQKADQQREVTLRTYILQQHQTSQITLVKAPKLAAREGYEIYFAQNFKSSPNPDEMHFYFAELLYDLEDYPKAAEQYELVTNNFKNSKHFEEAAKNLMITLERLLPKDEELQALAEKSLEPIPMSDSIKKFIYVATWYLQMYPKAEKAPEITFRVGRLYYLTNNFGPAETSFKGIVQKYPKTKVSEYSANLLLDIYSLKKDYAGLEKVGNELLTDQSIVNTKLAEDIRGVVEKSSFIKAQNLEAKGSSLESALQFTKFAEENPKSTLLAAAFFNAGVNFERAGKTKEAVNSYHQVMGLATTDKATRLQTKKLLVKLYQQTGQFELSAKLFNELAKENPAKDPLTQNYLFNAALMYELIGKTNESIDAYNRYRAGVKDETESADLLFKVTDLSRKSGLKNRVLPNYQAYINRKGAVTHKKIEAHYWVYKLSYDKYEPAAFKATENSIVKLTESLDADKKSIGNAFLAKLKLVQAEDIFEKLKAVSMPDKPEKQNLAVEKKLEIMNRLNDKLGEVIKLDSSAEIVTALNMAGQANENVVQTFKAAPLPKNLDADSKELYLAEIEKITAPFEAKAVDSHKLAVERGRTLKAYNGAYHDSFTRMSTRAPKDYYSPKEPFAMTNEISYIGEPMDATKAIAALTDNNTDVRALNALAVDYIKKGQGGAALSLLKKAESFEGKSPEIHNNIGVVYQTRKEEFDAITEFTKAQELNPKNYTAAINLASIFTTHKDYDRVITLLEEPAKKDLKSVEALTYYMIALNSKGKTSEAAAIQEKLQKLIPKAAGL
jgi:tetratricopeptide (TPR) repeat protein